MEGWTWRLYAMKRRLGSGRNSPPAGFEPATSWSEVGGANRSATRTLQRIERRQCMFRLFQRQQYSLASRNGEVSANIFKDNSVTDIYKRAVCITTDI